MSAQDVVERARTLADLGRYQQALDALSAQPELASDPEALCLAARANIGLKRWHAAIQLSRSAAAAAPEREWPRRLGSIAHMNVGQYPVARQLADESVRLAPHEWRAHLQRAHVDLTADQVNPITTAAASEAVRLAPHEPSPHVTLGNVALRRRQTRLARTAFTEALRLDPENAAARNNLALIDLRHRRLRRAVAGFAAAGRGDLESDLAARNLVATLAGGLRITGLLLLLTSFVVAALVADRPDGRWAAPAVTAAVLAGVLISWGVPATAWRRQWGLLPQIARQAGSANRSFAVWTTSMLVTTVLLLVAAVVGNPVAGTVTGLAIAFCWVTALGFLVYRVAVRQSRSRRPRGLR